MPNIHTCLWNDVAEFHFLDEDFESLRQLSQVTVRNCASEEEFLKEASSADVVLTWDFHAEWYEQCANLKLVMTPAAGTDWVEPDPDSKVRIVHGTFHGELLSESLIEALLFMNRRMKLMLDNYRHRGWNRNLQQGTNTLSEQTVLIIGYGNIGQVCARVLRRGFGARVIGIRRATTGVDAEGVEIQPISELDALLPEADHVVLLLPGVPETDGLMTVDRLSRCKSGAFVYNFGRGNALQSEDLLQTLDHLGGAYLDVTDTEPLPDESPLWSHPKVMITPHSSCVFASYRSRFLAEVKQQLMQDFSLATT